MMNIPRRLFDDSESSLERALLHAGRSYRGSPTARAKTLTALGLAASAAVTSATSTAGASALAKAGWAKLVAVSALGAAAVLPVAIELWPESSTPAAAIVVPSQPVAAPLPTEPASSESSPEPEATTEAEAPAAPAVAPRRTQRTPAGLTDELAALDSVRAALSGGRTRQAMTLLDAYARNHPRGRLRVEAEVLRIDALASSGQRDAAKKRASAFLERHPNSVLAPRVRSYL
jgi:hypothetical protein